MKHRPNAPRRLVVATVLAAVLAACGGEQFPGGTGPEATPPAESPAQSPDADPHEPGVDPEAAEDAADDRGAGGR